MALRYNPNQMDAEENMHTHRSPEKHAKAVVQVQKTMALSRNALGVIRALYYTLIVESNRGATFEVVEHILAQMTRRLDNQVGEDVFSAFVCDWLTDLENHRNVHPPLKESFLRKMMMNKNYSDDELYIRLALLVNESNKVVLKMHSHISPSWVSIVQKLFFTLDVCGHGWISSANIQHLFLALACNGHISHKLPPKLVAASQGESKLLQNWSAQATRKFLMSIASHLSTNSSFDGIVTLHAFQLFFADVESHSAMRALEATIAAIEEYQMFWKELRNSKTKAPVGLLLSEMKESSMEDARVGCNVPFPWAMAVLQESSSQGAHSTTQMMLADSGDEKNDLIRFLLLDAVAIRWRCVELNRNGESTWEEEFAGELWRKYAASYKCHHHLTIESLLQDRQVQQVIGTIERFGRLNRSMFRAIAKDHDFFKRNVENINGVAGFQSFWNGIWEIFIDSVDDVHIVNAAQQFSEIPQKEVLHAKQIINVEHAKRFQPEFDSTEANSILQTSIPGNKFTELIEKADWKEITLDSLSTGYDEIRTQESEYTEDMEVSDFQAAVSKEIRKPTTPVLKLDIGDLTEGMPREPSPMAKAFAGLTASPMSRQAKFSDSFVNGGEVIKAGVLLKKGSGYPRRNWKKRFFVLTLRPSFLVHKGPDGNIHQLSEGPRAQLAYYESPTDASPKGTMQLDLNSQIVPSISGLGKTEPRTFVFGVRHPDPTRRQLTLQAASDVERSEWIKALQAVVSDLGGKSQQIQSLTFAIADLSEKRNVPARSPHLDSTDTSFKVSWDATWQQNNSTRIAISPNSLDSIPHTMV